jgi:hypothetical protein
MRDPVALPPAIESHAFSVPSGLFRFLSVVICSINIDRKDKLFSGFH